MLLLKQNAKLKLSYSLVVAGIFAGLLTGIYNYTYNLALERSARLYAAAEEEYSTRPEAKSPERPEWSKLIEVNLADLKAKNPDVIGWIYFENDPISYPILFSENDNDKYLHYDYTGQRAVAGSIFMDGRNQTDFSSSRTLIYGHNTHDDKTMFTRLTHYLEPDYLENHRYFQIITEDAYYRYEITETELILPTDPRFTLKKADKKSSNKHIVMLSTCYENGKKRVLLTSKRVDTYHITD